MQYIKISLLVMLMGISSLGACQTGTQEEKQPSKKASAGVTFNINKSDEEWRKVLSPAQYQVMREKGTERAFSGKYNDFEGKGIYHCAACGQALFSSATKFDSGTGWPSFYKPLNKEAVAEIQDNEYGMVRTEVVCSNCGGHLGHVFPDGPKPTGLRYCLNSVSLAFEAKK